MNKKVSTNTTIAGIKMDNCINNASGAHCQTKEQLMDLNNSMAGYITTKTCTYNSRIGNEEPRYYSMKNKSIQSMGLPNMGYSYYIDLDSTFNKPYCMSVQYQSDTEYKKIINSISHSNVDLVEVNLSCPNIVGKPQIGYDFETVEKVINMTLPCKKKIGLKLPPYFEEMYFDVMAGIINKYNISFITCINSLGNGLIVDPVSESTVIRPKNGLGGIGGSIIKPIALSNVYQFSNRLDNVSIIGCGGINNGTDVFEHILVGACAVQIGTALADNGPGCFTRLTRELKEIMNSKGYTSIADFQGKIKKI